MTDTTKLGNLVKELSTSLKNEEIKKDLTQKIEGYEPLLSCFSYDNTVGFKTGTTFVDFGFGENTHKLCNNAQTVRVYSEAKLTRNNGISTGKGTYYPEGRQFTTSSGEFLGSYSREEYIKEFDNNLAYTLNEVLEFESIPADLRCSWHIEEELATELLGEDWSEKLHDLKGIGFKVEWSDYLCENIEVRERYLTSKEKSELLMELAYNLLDKEEEIKITNCTPHPVNIEGEDGKTRNFPKSETPARVSVKKEHVGSLLGISVSRETFGDVVGLPEENDGVFLIVSRMVAAALTDRHDLLVPGDLIRNEKGQIVGARGVIAPNGFPLQECPGDQNRFEE